LEGSKEVSGEEKPREKGGLFLPTGIKKGKGVAVATGMMGRRRHTEKEPTCPGKKGDFAGFKKKKFNLS